MNELTPTALYDFIFRRTADGLIVMRADRVIAQVNPAAAALLGIPPDALIGHAVGDVLTRFPTLLHVLTSRDDQPVDVRLPKRRLAVGFAASLPDGGRVAVLQDVSEKRELDARREQFITTLAHDLRNPIGALIGYSDLISISGSLSADQTLYLNRVKHTADKLHEIAAELVDLAWIEAGMPMQHVPIALRAVIDAAVSLTAEYAQSKDIVIALSVQDPLPLVMGDPRRLVQALGKLLHNAIHYSEAEQMIIIHAWGDLEKACCSVADRGMGITPDEIDHVFDRMFRSHDPHVRALPGGGLGLTLAKRIITRHGGDLTVTSRHAKGSTFTIMLPAVQP